MNGGVVHLYELQLVEVYPLPLNASANEKNYEKFEKERRK